MVVGIRSPFPEMWQLLIFKPAMAGQTLLVLQKSVILTLLHVFDF